MNSSEYGAMLGWYPAIVKTYDAATRTCRVQIPGITDGGDALPLAEIAYSLGDKSRNGAHATETEILSGDAVWVVFQGGDPRYPIITAYRNPRSGNSSAWRRVHHANIEHNADTAYKIKSGSTIELEAGASITLKCGASTLLINDASITLQSGQINLNGPISGGGASGAAATFSGDIYSSKDVIASSISLNSHTHTGDSGGNTSGPK